MVRKINEDKLISAVKRVFEKTRSKFCKLDRIEPLLLEEGLTQEEAKQAISLARTKRIIRACRAHAGNIRGELCYELLTDEDREFAKELEKQFSKKHWP